MFKLIIPTLSVALLCNSIATAQYFGTQYSASPGYKQPARPMRIARATDNESTPSPSDNLDDLDDLDSLDALDAPAVNSLQPPETQTLDQISPIDKSESLDTSQNLDTLALPDMPERLELPQPAEIEKNTVPGQTRSVQPEISANDFDSLEPISPMQSIVEPSPSTAAPLSGPIDFNEAIQQQQHDFTQARQQSIYAQQHSATHHNLGQTLVTSHPMSTGECQGNSASNCGSGQCGLPYRTPILPPPNSFYGHFRSNPCYFDLWATYPAEAAAACAHNRRKLERSGSAKCSTCELVAPCPCR